MTDMRGVNNIATLEVAAVHWITVEAARYCILNRLRTFYGGPAQVPVMSLHFME